MTGVTQEIADRREARRTPSAAVLQQLVDLYRDEIEFDTAPRGLPVGHIRRLLAERNRLRTALEKAKASITETAFSGRIPFVDPALMREIDGALS